MVTRVEGFRPPALYRLFIQLPHLIISLIPESNDDMRLQYLEFSQTVLATIYAHFTRRMRPGAIAGALNHIINGTELKKSVPICTMKNTRIN